LLIASVLLGVFMFSLIQMANARKMPPPKKFIVTTQCCGEGGSTGASNDCDEGGSSCVDHHCAQGETETTAPTCP
jgi:hypothetical protein